MRWKLLPSRATSPFLLSACQCQGYHSGQGVYGHWPKRNPQYDQIATEARSQRSVAGSYTPPRDKKQSFLDGLRQLLRDRSPRSSSDDSWIVKLKAAQLVDAYRQHGHEIGQIDPLSLSKPYNSYCFADDYIRNGPVELSLDYHGLSEHRDTAIDTHGLDLHACPNSITIGQLVHELQHIYCGPLTAEFAHLETYQERLWFMKSFEAFRNRTLIKEDRIFLAHLLLKCELFDNFVGQKLATVKRYGGEGAESMMGFFWQLFRQAPRKGLEQIVIGMPHRGRLNTLAVLLDYPVQHMFQKMRGLPEFPADVDGLGDVLSHLSTSVDVSFFEEGPVHVMLLPNSSHLEAVNPIVAGKARAREQSLACGDYSADESNLPGDVVLPVQIHGDASLAGQGIVAETLAMSQTPHYRVGGTVHLVVNNQLGYTTPQERGRSSRYATDIAKVSSCPVIHVNGDYPEQVVIATELALKYRHLFRKDVFVDMVCYRRWGHNELDDPSFTQPQMYSVIEARPSVVTNYFKKLEAEGIVTEDMKTTWTNDYFDQHLGTAFKNIDSYQPTANHLSKQWCELVQAPKAVEVWDTGVDIDMLKFVGAKSVHYPDTFTTHPHLSKVHVGGRMKQIEEGAGINWATAEALAFGSLLLEGFPVRLSGEDVGRGTFSQRHALLVNHSDSSAHIPLNHIHTDQSAFLEVANSILSEEAVLGFEYGMTLESPKRLVVWEAQFGDFFNGAQIIIDAFVTSGECKWLTQSGLVMLLPHGYDGAGPEHSSCRIERFLQMCDSKEASADGANVNFEFAHPTTSAQYFHLLRRQIILCSGKHYYALRKHRETLGADNVAIIRLESLCPFPVLELQEELKRFSAGCTFTWSQEEPRNQGPWVFVERRFRNLLGIQLNYVGRDELPIPAVAIGQLHSQQHEQVLERSFSY